MGNWAIRTALVSAAAVLLLATPALAQRAEQNATTQSSDAFGRSVGNERSGLYSGEEVRGFNPGEAGNIRLEGLFFEFAGFLSQRLNEGSTVRVGLAAQRYPFPAPSGLIDYRLVVPKDKREISLDIDSAGSFARGPGFTADVKLPIDGERLGIAVGVGARAARRVEGGRHSFSTWSALVAFRPAEGTEVLAFGSATYNISNEARPLLFPIGTAPPPQIERGRFLGFDWTETSTTGMTNGAIARVALGDGWRVHAGLFYSKRDQEGSYADLVTSVAPDGRGNRTVIAEDGNGEKIWSGEFRLIREWQEGALAHTVTASVRGRAKDRRFGGAVPLRLGSGLIEDPASWPVRPAFTLGAKNTDEVRQLAAGISYNLLWQGRASLDIGLSKATYAKSIDFADPALADPVTRDKPLLWNVAASVSLSRNVIAFAGMSRGQEDALIAPDIAVNRSEAPPAIRTRQVEAGLKFQLTRDLSLVTGVFEISRPYYNLDSTQRYRELGRLTNRGLEVSLTGKLAPGLNIVGGMLLTDPKIAGEAVTSRQIGQRPVGQVRRRIVANLDWRTKGGKGPLSFDINAEAQSSRMGNVANTLAAPPRANFNIGARYRFDLAGAQVILRPQLQNVFNHYGWQVSSSGGFLYTPDRVATVSLSADW
jgi:iron complex outermembrane recepter protein